MKLAAQCAAIVAAALTLSGCGRVSDAWNDLRSSVEDYDKAARQSQEWREAEECLNSRDVDGAVAKYYKVCELHPRAAIPHLQLASVLHEHRQDYVGAIYNYRMYLEKTDDRSHLERITNMMQRAELELSHECASRISPSGLPQTLRVELKYRSLNKAIASAQAGNTELEAANAKLVEEIRDAEARIEQRLSWIDRLRQGGGEQ